MMADWIQDNLARVPISRAMTHTRTRGLSRNPSEKRQLAGQQVSPPSVDADVVLG